MLSSFDFPTYMARAFALGALGYLLKSATRSEIVAAIKTASKGDSIWSKEQLRCLSGGLISHSGAAIDIPFTKRESEVMKQLALGLINREIAQALGIRYETVKEHVQHILRKLGVTDRTQAAVWAVRNKLI
jgi:DNA-binding NarL/FixJ family response regulator